MMRSSTVTTVPLKDVPGDIRENGLNMVNDGEKEIPHVPTPEYLEFQARADAGKRASFRQKLSIVFGEPADTWKHRTQNPRRKK